MIKVKNLGSLYDPVLGSNNLALIDCENWEFPRCFTHFEIEEKANACARGLLKKRVKRQGRVGILSGNCVEFIISYLGILRAGLTAVPINHKFSADIINFIIEDAEISLMLFDGSRLNTDNINLPASQVDMTDKNSFEKLLDPGYFNPVTPTDADVAMILYTSGSTGRPKGVPLTHKGHIWAIKARIGKEWPFPDHRLLVAAPLHHMNALCTTLFGLAVSTTTVLLPEFESSRYLAAIGRFQCTWITSVPSMLSMCFANKKAMLRADLSSVKVVRMGSAPVSPKLWTMVHEAFPGASITNVYGTTEAGPIVFGSGAERDPPEFSVGYQHPDIDLKLVDKDGREAQQGVLWQRTPATSSGYLNLPDKSHEVFTSEGWYISGDVFRRDNDEAYYFVGRSDDMFNCGGENIYPGEIEAILARHPEIQESCVVPVPDEIKGEKPVAFVVSTSKSDLNEAAIKRYVLENAPPYQHPRMVFFMEALPLMGPGKIDRKSLKDKAHTFWIEKQTAN